jgi:hypothetical protein
MIPGDHAKGRDQTRSPKFSVSNLNSLSFEQLSDKMDQMDDSRLAETRSTYAMDSDVIQG